MTTTTIRTRGRHRRSAWQGFAPVAALLALLAVLILAACGGTSTPLAGADEPRLTSLEQAEKDCGSRGVDVFDAGRTLIVDHKGEDDTTGASIDALVCVLVTLGAPTSAVAKMENTRALDGVQSTSWGSYTATWSFHPDSGLDLIIEEG